MILLSQRGDANNTNNNTQQRTMSNINIKPGTEIEYFIHDQGHDRLVRDTVRVVTKPQPWTTAKIITKRGDCIELNEVMTYINN